MISLFGGKKPDHPMSDIKEAKKLLDELPSGDAAKCVDELGHWLESVMAEAGFKPDYRAQLVALLDETAQPHVRKLVRDYLATSRQAKYQEMRLWKSICDYWRLSGAAYAACVDLYAAKAKGADALKSSMPLLLARALRALASQVKWMYVRYGPMDQTLWGAIAKVYAIAEEGKFAQAQVTLNPGIPGVSTPEQEFLKAVMLSMSSPDSLLPLEIEIGERLIAHFCSSFTVHSVHKAGAAYWIDLAAGRAPARLAQAPQAAPGLRYISTGNAVNEMESLASGMRSSGSVPAQVNLGGSYAAEPVLQVLEHLAQYWSAKAPERRHQRHRVKSRLSVTHDFDGVLAALGPEGAGDGAESWIVENVSAGGFGVSVPEIKGDWLKIGSLLGMQPEGGDNWVLGVVRRMQREAPQKASVGVQTIAKSARPVELSTGAGDVTGILLADGVETLGETRVLLRPGTYLPGQNLEYQNGNNTCLLMPQGLIETNDEYDLAKYREMIREVGEE